MAFSFFGRWKMEIGARAMRVSKDKHRKQLLAEFFIDQSAASVRMYVSALSAMCVQQLHLNDNLNSDRKSDNKSNKLNDRTKNGKNKKGLSLLMLLFGTKRNRKQLKSTEGFWMVVVLLIAVQQQQVVQQAH